MTETNTTKIFSDRLDDLMYERKITLRDLESATGISRSALNNYKRDVSECGINNVVKLAKYFGVSADYLLGLSDAETNDKDVQFICDYTRISAEAVESLKYRKLAPYISANNFLTTEAVKSSLYFVCRDEFLKSNAFFEIISCVLYEKILYNHLLELKKMADENKLDDNFETYDIYLATKRWENQHKIHLFNAQNAIVTFMKQYVDIESLDRNLYNSLVELASIYTPFEDEQKKRDAEEKGIDDFIKSLEQGDTNADNN